MKECLLAVTLVLRLPALAQENASPSALELSAKIFQWEVAGNLDSLADVLHPHLIVSGSDGGNRSKEEYMQRLTSGIVVHNSVQIEDGKAIIADNTAIVTGRGRFILTSGGSKNMLHLSYMEAFCRPDSQSGWKLLAIKATILPN